MRVVGVSKRGLQDYVNDKSRNISKKVKVKNQHQGRLTKEGDELWSFVKAVENQPWVWLAQYRQTKEIVGVAIGDRFFRAATQLWNSLPGVLSQGAVSYTEG